MNINVTTKFNIGDKVYMIERYEDYFPNKNVLTIKGISFDVDHDKQEIRYYVSAYGRIHSVPEHKLFTSYEECTIWCDEHND